MTKDPDPIDRLSRALDQTGAIIAGVGPDQAALPTPCSAWDVRALIAHLMQDLRHFTARAGGETPDRESPGGVGEDWTGAYREAADGLLAAWRREGALDRTLDLPVGQVPATWILGQHVADVVVHGWDIAKATGQSTDLDPELGEFSLDWAKESLKPEFRGPEESGRSFGPEVPVAADAPVYDRLAGFFGRDPRGG